MKVLITMALFVGAVSAIPISPALKQMMQDMLKTMLRNMNIKAPPQNNGFPPPRMPAPIAPPNAFQTNPMMGGMGGPPQGAPPGNGGNGLLAMPPGTPGFGGQGGYFPKEYCPPGAPPATLNDSCKEQILIEALYFPSGKPRYPWVRYPISRWDPSVPDFVKDQARSVLYHKIGNRVPTAKEARLMAVLGDPPNHMLG